LQAAGVKKQENRVSCFGGKHCALHSVSKCRSPVLWVEIEENQLIEPELVQETTDKVVDKTLRFVEEPIDIIDGKVKRLKYSRILIVKVHWNSKQGHEDYMKAKCGYYKNHKKKAKTGHENGKSTQEPGFYQ
nr:putative reverse transcriptase domain-containing protein [Tanacetum cinerariifolium]